ncbi:TPA: hypothetical protein U2I65_003988 [Providencia stuartii]|nr:hypothetical protein [Providencia stuartii]
MMSLGAPLKKAVPPNIGLIAITVTINLSRSSPHHPYEQRCQVQFSYDPLERRLQNHDLFVGKIAFTR